MIYHFPEMYGSRNYLRSVNAGDLLTLNQSLVQDVPDCRVSAVELFTGLMEEGGLQILLLLMILLTRARARVRPFSYMPLSDRNRCSPLATRYPYIVNLAIMIRTRFFDGFGFP